MRKMNVQTPMEVTVSAYPGHQTEGFADQVPLAGVVVERWYMAPGVHRIPISDDGVTATLFLPSGRTRRRVQSEVLCLPVSPELDVRNVFGCVTELCSCF